MSEKDIHELIAEVSERLDNETVYTAPVDGSHAISGDDFLDDAHLVAAGEFIDGSAA